MKFPCKGGIMLKRIKVEIPFVIKVSKDEKYGGRIETILYNDWKIINNESDYECCFNKRASEVTKSNCSFPPILPAFADMVKNESAFYEDDTPICIFHKKNATKNQHFLSSVFGEMLYGDDLIFVSGINADGTMKPFVAMLLVIGDENGNNASDTNSEIIDKVRMSLPISILGSLEREIKKLKAIGYKEFDFTDQNFLQISQINKAKDDIEKKIRKIGDTDKKEGKEIFSLLSLLFCFGYVDENFMKEFKRKYS